MNEAVEEWVRKAEGDLQVALREFKVIGSPNYDAICFHSQQCAEKYLKAFLISQQAPFPKTHDLEALLDLALEFQSEWEVFRNGLASLTDMGIEVRYPGLFADAEMADECLRIAMKFREAARRDMDLT